MEYILKKCSSDEYLIEGHVFTEKIEEAARFTAEEAKKKNMLLQLDHITTWIYDAEHLNRVF